MAGKCCGDHQMPDILADKRLVNAHLIDTKIGVDMQGDDVYAGDCFVTCDDLARGAAVSKDEGNVVRPGNDGGAYVGISTDPKNVTKVDSKGNIITPISSSANNATRKGPDGGIYTGISTDPKNVTKLDGSGNIITPISSDQNNIVKKGSDGGIYAGIAAGGGVAVDQNGNIKLAIKGCDGNVHADGTTIPSCAQMNAAIGAAKQAAVDEAVSRIPPPQDVMGIVRAGLGTLISGDAGNIIRLGGDSKLYAASTGGGGTGAGGGVGSFYTSRVTHASFGGDGNGGSYTLTATINLRNLTPGKTYLLKINNTLASFTPDGSGSATITAAKTASDRSGDPPIPNIEEVEITRTNTGFLWNVGAPAPGYSQYNMVRADQTRAKGFATAAPISLFAEDGSYLTIVSPA